MKRILTVFVSLTLFCCYSLDFYVPTEREITEIQGHGFRPEKRDFIVVKSAAQNPYFFVFTPSDEDHYPEVIIFKSSIDERNFTGRVSGHFSSKGTIRGFVHYPTQSSRDKRLVQDLNSRIDILFNSFIEATMYFNEPNKFAQKEQDGDVIRDEAISIDDRTIDYIKYTPGDIWPKALKKTIFQRGKSAEKMAPSAIKLPDVIAKSMKSFRQQRKETPLFPHCEKMDNGFHIAYEDNITYFIVEDGDKIYIAVSFKDVPFLLFCCDGSAFRAHFCDESGSTRIEIAPDPLLVHTIFHLRDEKPVHISYKDAFDSENLFEIKLVE